jgi:uncharacterized protein (DUF3084 family)
MEKKKKNIAIVAAIITVFLIAVVGIYIVSQKDQEIKSLDSQKQNLGQEIAKRDSVLNDLFGTFNEIESSLTYIKQKRGQLELKLQESGESQKESILNDIKLLDMMLEKDNQKIAELNKKLHNSGIQIASLTKRISELTQSIETQNSEISNLKQTIDERDTTIADLNTKVEGLVSEVSEKDKSLTEKSEIITSQDKELNKGYLAFGSYKELKDNGILTNEGGFLGLGKNKSLSGNLKEDNFIKLDIRETREIPLFSRKASFITQHPDGSYHFVTEKGMTTYLEIDHPESFWKLSKYAVIETR